MLGAEAPDGDGIFGFTLETDTDTTSTMTVGVLMAELVGQDDTTHVLAGVPHGLRDARGFMEWVNFERATVTPQELVLHAVNTFDGRQF